MSRRPSRILEGLGDLPRPFQLEPAPGTLDLPEERSEPIDPVAEALERGRQEGRLEGRRTALVELAAQKDALRHDVAVALRDIATFGEEQTRSLTELMKELALAAASRIVRERVEAGDPVAVRALEESLDALPENDAVQARVHPDDMPSIRQELGDAIERRRIELIADESVARGGCVVHGDCGSVDATLEAALDAVGAAVHDRAEQV